MVEFLVPLAYVYDLAKWICDNKLIRPEKILRVMIQDSSDKQNNSMQVFYGAKEDDYSSYYIVLKGLLDKDESFKEYESKTAAIMVEKIGELEDKVFKDIIEGKDKK